MYKINYFTAFMQLNLAALYRKRERITLPCKVFFFLFLLLCVLTTACSKKNHSFLPAYQFKTSNGLPDYADLRYWAAHPWKKDPADSVPLPLRPLQGNDSAVDVFFIHPTTFTSSKDTQRNADIDDAELNAKTDYTTILYQASAFNQNTRVFAPRYRQMHYRLFFSPRATTGPMNIAYADIEAAFQYYLEHFNNGRPIILAAHSQGSIHANRLLKKYFEGTPLLNKLVCAYMIGMPIPLPKLTHTTIGPCKDSLATGCYVGWRTFKKGYEEGKFPEKLGINITTTNPLTWTLDSLLAPSALNTGAILKNFNKLKPGVTNAQVHGSVLWAQKPRFFGNFLITTKIYHVGDINLYYNNIRQNMAARIKQYLLHQKQ
jgi:Protein of unknown function (DUF3089)